MAKIIIDDFTGGLAPKYWINSTTFGNRFGKPGQFLAGEVNPFYLPGFLIGGNSSYSSPTNESNLTDSGRIEDIVAVDDNIIDTGTGTSIYYINSSSTPEFGALNASAGTIQYSASTPKWPKVANTSSGTHSGHTNMVFDDIFRYQVNGSYKTLVMMRDATDWDILKWDSTLTGGDVLGNVGSSATNYTTSLVDILRPTFAVPADNGYCYICNGSNIHRYDGRSGSGANGSLKGNVLSFSNSDEIVDALDYKGKLWILKQPRRISSASVPSVVAAEKFASWPERDISVVIWNRDSSAISAEDSIKIEGASEVFAIRIVGGIVHVWGRGGGATASSSRGILRLWAYDGSKFVLVKELGQSQDGQPTTRNSFAYYMGGIVWHDISGILWWYGNVVSESGEIRGSLFQIGKNSAGGVTNAGAILSGSFGILVPRLESSVAKLGAFNPMDSSSAGNVSYIYFAPIEFPKLSTINGITIIYFAEANVSTATVGLDIYNKHNATAITKYIDLDVDVPRGYSYFPLALEKTNILGLRLASMSSLTNATMPKIMRIEIDYTPTPRLK